MNKNTKLQNPFKYGQTVENTCFFDRDHERATLFADFNNSQNIIIISPRRYGKSSLLKRVLSELSNKKFIYLYIDLFRTDSMEKLLSIFAAEFTEASQTPLKKVGDFFKNLAPRLKPTITIKGDDVPEFSFDFSQKTKETSQGFTDILQAFYHFVSKKKIKGVIVFDEFQEILEWGDQALLKEFRAAIQSHHNIAYCFAGSKRHVLSEMFLKQASPLFHSGKILSLAKIPYNDFKKYLTKSFAPLQISATDILIINILEFTSHHPYYTQMLAYHFWEACVYDKQVTLDQVIRKILTFQHDAYTSLWELLSHRQKRLMISLANNESRPLTQARVIHEWDLGSSATVTKTKADLERENFIEKNTENRVVISDPFFKTWIKIL